MAIYDLNPEEERIIHSHREQRAKDMLEIQMTMRILRTAATFYAWKIDRGTDSSYSRFCDDFGYVADLPNEDRGVTYSCVLSVIQAARTAVERDGQ